MYLVDANGNEVAAYDYDPYGKIISATGTMAEINPLRYRGYYYDAETGFYYLQSRYYDPEICRFINADSYASTGQGYMGYNMFAYCNNSPILHSDPSGEILVTTVILIVSAAVGVTVAAITAYESRKAGYDWADTAFYSIGNGLCAFAAIYSLGMTAYGVYLNYCSLKTLTPITEIGKPKQSSNPLDGITYTSKVLKQATKDDFHGFPESVDGFGQYGRQFQQIGNDGRVYTHLEIEGSYKGYDGIFEYIWDADFVCNHRLFKNKLRRPYDSKLRRYIGCKPCEK